MLPTRLIFLLYRYRNVDPAQTNASPTPREFAQYIVDSSQRLGSENLNSHIKPIWSSCPFCLIDFDVIGHLENFDEDTKFIRDQLQLDIPIGLHRNHASGKSSTSDKRKEFFAEDNMPKELVRKLYQIYQLDFDMFGYELPAEEMLF